MDCIQGMDLLIKNNIKVDAIIADIPYGTTACSWDTIIPFDDMWKRLNKLVKNNGAICLFGKEPFTSTLIMSNIKNFKERIDWLKNKSGNGFNVDQKHIQVIEDICVFANSTTYTFNPQTWLVSEKEFLTQRKTFNEVEVGNNIYSKIKRVRKPDTGERNPINIVSYPVPFTPSKNKTYSENIDLRFHPTQKPIVLMEYLINTYSNENELVLDFTIGSGTTAISCINTNRNFIGFELQDDIYKVAKNRVNNHIIHKNLQDKYKQIA